jgi:hypothetical protein
MQRLTNDQAGMMLNRVASSQIKIAMIGLGVAGDRLLTRARGLAFRLLTYGIPPDSP